MAIVSRWQFLKRFFTNFHELGAVTPSSGAVARAMADQANLGNARIVVELGPGTGVVTRELLRRLPADGRLYAFEIDPAFVDHLRATIDDPRLVVVAESAERLDAVLAARGAVPVDAVFSEVPFANMPEPLRCSILAACRSVLRDGGSIVVLQYLPFLARRLLRALFPHVRIAAYVPANVPPAFILSASSAPPALRPPVEPVALPVPLAAVFFFMRDPRRYPVAAVGEALAPADGTVIGIEVVRDSYWHEEMREIRLFLSIVDVHVQRSPIAGRVVRLERTPGARLPAMRHDATHRNERCAIYVDGDGTRCVVTQIAGALARTIVTWVRVGQDVRAGEKLGMIRLGSQTTVRLPLAYHPAVRVGDSVRAGIDVIARRPPG